MKSAYELAMERLGQQAPVRKLSGSQKQRMAELDSVCQARIAQLDLAMQEEVTRFLSAGDAEKAAQARATFIAEKQQLERDREAQKETIRNEPAA